MPRKLEINIWDIYNRLTIIKEVEQIKQYRYFLCKCECWKEKVIQLNSLKQWLTKSCGCLSGKNNTHWLARSRIYNIWKNIKQRCWNKKNTNYKRYWARWITYDPRWEKFENFYEDMKEWYSDNLSIDRTDNDWNYFKSNCKWVTNKDQQRNKQNNILHKWKCLSEWCEELNLNYNLIKSRINRWLPIDEALNIN